MTEAEMKKQLAFYEETCSLALGYVIGQQHIEGTEDEISPAAYWLALALQKGGSSSTYVNDLVREYKEQNKIEMAK